MVYLSENSGQGRKLVFTTHQGPNRFMKQMRWRSRGQLGRTVHFFRLHYGESVDNTLKLWDLTTGTEFKTLTGHTAYINAIAITGDGQKAISAALRQHPKSLGFRSGETIATFSLILLRRCVQWSIFLTTRRDRATNINFLRGCRRGAICPVTAAKS